jgi:hypothetical protein
MFLRWMLLSVAWYCGYCFLGYNGNENILTYWVRSFTFLDKKIWMSILFGFAVSCVVEYIRVKLVSSGWKNNAKHSINTTN